MRTPILMRQGDVLLVRVNSTLPEGVPVARDNGRVVLAYGEVTGHAHAITDPDVMLMTLPDKDAMKAAVDALLASVGLTTEIRSEEIIGVLHVPTNASLVHEEHNTISLKAEHYVALRQREYSPERIQQVLD